jgi:small basic protein
MLEQVQSTQLLVLSHLLHLFLSDLLVFLGVDLGGQSKVGIIVTIIAHQISLD